MTEASDRVRKSEAKRKAKGLRQIRLWVPDNQDDINAVKAIAKAMCDGVGVRNDVSCT